MGAGTQTLVDAGTQTLVPSAAAFPGTLTGSCTGSAQVLESAPTWCVGVEIGELTHCTTKPACYHTVHIISTCLCKHIKNEYDGELCRFLKIDLIPFPSELCGTRKCLPL